MHIQSKMGDLSNQVIQNMEEHHQQPEVVVASVNALANLMFDNKENTTEQIRKAIQLIQNIEDITPVVALSACQLYNNLAYENDDVKELMGQLNVIEHLIKIFTIYSKDGNVNIEVLDQCLRALGNLAIHSDNSELIVKYMFSDYLGLFIQKNPDEIQIIKLGLEVIQTVT